MNKKHTHLFAAVLALSWFLVLASPARAQEFYAQDKPLDVSMDLYALGPDAGPLLVLTLAPDEGWYTYAGDHTGRTGTPPAVRAELVPDNTPLDFYLPPGADKPDPFSPGQTMRVYPDKARLFVPLPPETAPPFRVKLRLTAPLCDGKRCAEMREDLLFNQTQPLIDLPDADDQPWHGEYLAARDLGPVQIATKGQPTFRPAIDTGQWNFEPEYFRPGLEVSGLLMALGLGMLAGLILNVMPCVLPVVSLKISGLLAAAAETDEHARNRDFREHNLFFALGIATFFLILAAIFGLGDLAWGELFQTPGTVLVLAALVTAMALSLFGVFDLPVVDLKLGSESKSPRIQALATGMLATLLATPCSGPFLGGVLGWTLMRSPMHIAAVFLSVGLGMALPYLLMAALPSLSRFFPRPGAWTLYVERIAGFFLAGTAAYLLTILPSDRLPAALVALWCTGLAAWVYGLAKPTLSDSKRALLRLAALAVLVNGLAWALSPPAPAAHWQDFDADQFNTRLGKTAMVVDFTADWCPTCKYLEATALTPENLGQWRRDHLVEFVRVDLSSDNPDGEALLKALGSSSIPTLAIFPKGGSARTPLVLRDLFTASQLTETLNETLNRQRQ